MKYYSLLLILCFYLNGDSQNVSEIIIKGNKKSNTTFLKNQITLKVDNKLDSLKISNDIKRLKRLVPVANAYYKVIKLSADNYKVLYIIEENLTIIPSINIFTSNDGEFAYRIGLQEFNFLGKNIKIGAYYQKDIYNSHGFEFKAPYLFNNKFGIGINYQNFTSLEPVYVEKDVESNYKYNNNSLEVLGLYKISLMHKLAVGINFFTEHYKYENGPIKPLIPLEISSDKLAYKLIYEFDNLNKQYQHIKGFKSILNVQYVTSSNINLPEFLIGFNDFLFFKQIGSKGNFANRLRIGIATNSDSPFAPFSLDNNLNIRGVGNTIDRGTAAMVLNSEYRYSIYEKDWFVLQTNAFVDFGSWRNPGGNFNDLTNFDNMRLYPGLGLRFIHKKIVNAVFRIDYGYGISKKSSSGFVFGIGQYF